MGAVPKKKLSRRRRGNRRSHQGLKPTGLVECPQCHQMRLPHRVCPHCGTYRGIQAIAAKES